MKNLRSQCDVLITAMVGKDLVDRWWNGSNKAFDGKSPEVIFATEPKTVYAYLINAAEGEW